MINYIKMKIFYYQMKKQIFQLFLHGDLVIDFIKNLAISCKDMTGDELRKEVIDAIADKAHEEAQRQKVNEEPVAK